MQINNQIPDNDWAFGNFGVGAVVYHEGLFLMVLEPCRTTDVAGVTEEWNAVDLDDGMFYYVEPSTIVTRVAAEMTVRPWL